MPSSSKALLLLPLCLTSCLGDLLGPTYPAPLDLSGEDSPLRPAWEEFTSILDGYLDGSSEDEATAEVLIGLEDVTFSIGAFSLHNPAVAEGLQYHYTSNSTKELFNGSEVDGDTIYQLASITKLFTVYAGLLELTEEQWNTPLTEAIPSLGAYVQNQTSNGELVTTTQWDQITPWTLANHLGGQASQGPLLDSLLASLGEAPVLPIQPLWQELLGLTDESELDADLYIELATTMPSILPPWSSTVYANNGFILLGIALSSLLDKQYAELIQEAIAAPLGLTSTSGGRPADSNLDRVVVLDPSILASPALLAPSGGAFSSLNDLSLFGTALLNSTQLSPATTRKWMKPSGHTASLNHSVGAPWEIFRYTSPTSGKVIDFYTKSGASGNAVSHMVLIPDYGFGFSYISVANTSDPASTAAVVINPVLDLITASLLPALEEQAATEAAANFAGSYASAELNATVTIAWNESSLPDAPPALTLTEFTFNGTDLLATALFGEIEAPRLLLSFPEQDGDGQVVFQATTSGNTPSPLGIFSSITSYNLDWISFGGKTWSGNAVGQFVFEVDGDGKAGAVMPAALGAKLERVEKEE